MHSLEFPFKRLVKGEPMSLQTANLDELHLVLDSLLLYVNRRFEIVRPGGEDLDSVRHAKSQLIERFLWEHRELIADFVRDNLDHFSQERLAIASDLADTLYGTLVLVDHNDESATLMHPTGVYRVYAPSRSCFSGYPNDPIELRGAIAPYQGSIILVPPFIVMGEAPAELVDHLRERLCDKGAQQPTSDPLVLAQRCKEWHGGKDGKRMDGSKSGDHRVAGPGPGFHRGVLAGLAGESRKRALTAHSDTLLIASGSYDRAMELRSVETQTLPLSLKEALLLLDDDWIADIALEFCDEPVAPQLPREELAQWICQRLEQDNDYAGLSLMCCLDEQFDLIGKLMTTNPFPMDLLTPTAALGLYPMIPFVFILRERGHLLAWMPPQIVSILQELDLDAIAEVRRQLAEVRSAARALATMCGIVSVSDLYERYRAIVKKPLSRKHFELALDDLEVCESRDDYAMWRHMGCDYVTSVEISDASAPARVVRESYADHIVNIDGISDQPHAPTLVGMSVEDEESFERRIQQKEKELERARLKLLETPCELPVHQLSPLMLQGDPVEQLAELGPLQALRSFVDAHVPDDQDDYEFPDLFVRSVIVSAVLMSEPYNDTMDLIRLYGMRACEGTDFSDTLGRLVTNAYNALPRWDLNGWSLEENTERLTGRRRFYHKDGALRHVGDNEPCPCGSGKPYKSCCGHLVVNAPLA